MTHVAPSKTSVASNVFPLGKSWRPTSRTELSSVKTRSGSPPFAETRINPAGAVNKMTSFSLHT